MTPTPTQISLLERVVEVNKASQLQTTSALAASMNEATQTPIDARDEITADPNTTPGLPIGQPSSNWRKKVCNVNRLVKIWNGYDASVLKY
jgi:hypothetical protein